MSLRNIGLYTTITEKSTSPLGLMVSVVAFHAQISGSIPGRRIFIKTFLVKLIIFHQSVFMYLYYNPYTTIRVIITQTILGVLISNYVPYVLKQHTKKVLKKAIQLVIHYKLFLYKLKLSYILFIVNFLLLPMLFPYFLVFKQLV